MNSSLRSAATLPEAVIAISFAAMIGTCVMAMIGSQTVDARQVASASNL